MLATANSEKGNSQLNLSHRVIAVADLLPTCSLIIESCTSDNWKSVGEALPFLSALKSLAILRCYTGDIIC